MNKKAALHNLGCKVNAYETEAMEQLLLEAGYEIVDFNQTADVYIINTCSVTNIADRKSRQMIHKARKQNPTGIIVAAGCYVQTSQEEAASDQAIDILIGNNRKQDLLPLIEKFELERNKNTDIININQPTEYEELSIRECKEHTRAFVKVQDGCNQFCSYCIIPYARGRVRSRAKEEVIQEIKNLAENGYQEVVLTGIHLSSYGVDLDDTLLSLIEEVHQVEGIKRIRLGSLEPGIITEDFVRRISSLPKVCPHFHLSLQSGCNETLKRMNRRYNVEEFAHNCRILRKYYEHPALTTDVIVGFPGETEEEFCETRRFLQEINFYEIHLFKYSRRKGTKADLMPEQLSEKTKAERSRILDLDQQPRKQAFIDYYKEREVEVLFEEEEQINESFYFTGYTPEYVKVYRKSDEDLTNQLKKIVFSGIIY